MVAKIKLEAEDRTKAAFDSLERNSQAAQESLDSVQSTMSQTQAAATLLASGFSQAEVAAMGTKERVELAEVAMNALDAALGSTTDNLIDVDREMQSLAEDAYRAAAAAGDAANGIDRTGDEAAQSSEQLERMDRALERTGGSSGSFVESMAKLWALKETFTKLAQGANYLAEQGNPAFVELRESGTKLFDSLVELAELEEVQIFIGTVSDGFKGTAEFIDENAHRLDDLIKGYKDLVEVAYSYMEAMGLVAEGTTEEIRRMKELEAEESKRYAEKLEAEKRAIQAAKQTEEANKAIHELEKSRAAEQETAAAKQIESVDEVLQKQQQEIDAMKSLADQAKLTEEAREASIRRINTLEDRRRELEAKAEKERVEAVTKSGTVEEQQARKVAEAEITERQALEEKLAEERYKANQDEIAAAEEHAKKLKDAYEAGADQGAVPQMDLEQLGGGVASAARVKKHYIDQKVDAADDDIEARYKADGAMDSQGKFSDAAAQKQYQAEVNRARAEAKKQAGKEINSGKADDELYRIQSDFAQGFIEQQGQQQGLSKGTIQALKQAAQATVKNKQETEQLKMELDEAVSFMQENLGARIQRQRKNY